MRVDNWGVVEWGGVGIWGRGEWGGGGSELGVGWGGGDPRDLLGAKGGSPGVEGKDGGHCYEGGGGHKMAAIAWRGGTSGPETRESFNGRRDFRSLGVRRRRAFPVLCGTSGTVKLVGRNFRYLGCRGRGRDFRTLETCANGRGFHSWRGIYRDETFGSGQNETSGSG